MKVVIGVKIKIIFHQLRAKYTKLVVRKIIRFGVVRIRVIRKLDISGDAIRN